VTAGVTIERYAPAAAGAWDEVVRAARARHFMFERAYMDYHGDRFADASWFVLLNDRPIAVLPASRDGDEVVSHGGLTFGGLLSRPELTTARAVSALGALTSALRADGVRRLVYKPMPHPYHLAPAEEDLHALSAGGAQLIRREVTAAVAPGARPAYSEERRRAVAKAATHPLELGESDSLEEFWALLRETLAERHGVEPVHSAAEMRLLAGRFPGRIRVFTASDAGEVVAGTVIFETPSVAHSQYIAASPRGRELHALDALFDHLLTQVFHGVWFDFGISNERDGRINAGLLRNKEGYGARALVHDRYLLDLG
jgi:hypothetical protein